MISLLRQNGRIFPERRNYDEKYWNRYFFFGYFIAMEGPRCKCSNSIFRGRSGKKFRVPVEAPDFTLQEIGGGKIIL